MQKAYVGIDPGRKGAAALLAPDKIHLQDWDDAKRAGLIIAEWAAQYDLRVAIEKVTSHKTDGHAYAFRFGTNYGIWQGICAGLFIKPTLIHHATWQSKTLPGWNKKGVDNKKTALDIVRRLYPAVKTAIYMRKHNGRADALLIATFAKGRGL
jgi:hypothetical protein